jgi:large subunit ribosomal protein L4
VEVHAAGGGTAGSVELPDDVFDVQANIPLMHQVVVAQLAAARQGTAKAKRRGEVRGGGRKPAAPARARPARRSSPVVAWCTVPCRAATRSARPRR